MLLNLSIFGILVAYIEKIRGSQPIKPDQGPVLMGFFIYTIWKNWKKKKWNLLGTI
jgi:hypothetical protein